MQKIISLIMTVLLLIGCGNSNVSKEMKFKDSNAFKIAAGSEIKELEPIIDEYNSKFNRNIVLEYMGSLDMMNLLSNEKIDFDAVWPASSIWLTMGDKNKVLKYSKTISITPIIFGIKKSKAVELGWIDKDVYIKDIIDAIENGKFSFAMTSATQSNSGASAYLGFLSAISNKLNGGVKGVDSQDLDNPKLQNAITKLLSGVNRSSGSSNWLVDLFIEGDYDAMINYETLIIKTNNELISKGREPLVAIYPVDGLVFSDAPLAFISKADNSKNEEVFLEFQEYLLSDEVQDKIEKTGRRSAFNTVRDSNKKYFNSEWGLNVDKIISPIKLPDSDTIEKALRLYQTSFKKPTATYYLLDYSGSMSGNGIKELNSALKELLIAKNAYANHLQSNPFDSNIFIPFASDVDEIFSTSGNEQELEDVYKVLSNIKTRGSTSMYKAIIKAIEHISRNNYNNKNISIVIMTDGMPTDSKLDNSMSIAYDNMNKDVPIFSILFGGASKIEMEKLAKMTRGKVFDGRKNLIKAFKDVRGYN